MRVGGVDLRTNPTRDGGEHKVAERETVPDGGQTATEPRSLYPVVPDSIEAPDAPQQRGDVVGLGFAPDALENLSDNGADECRTIIVEQRVHRFLFRGLRAVEEGGPRCRCQ